MLHPRPNQTRGKFADVAGWSTADGGNTEQWICAATANQSFRFHPMTCYVIHPQPG